MGQVTEAKRIKKYVEEWLEKQPELRSLKKYAFHTIGNEVKRLLECLHSCGMYEENKEHIETVALLSDLHDIGKLYVPAEILDKEASLTEKEWRIIKKHPVWGSRILETALLELERMRPEEDRAALRKTGVLAKEICLYHHERYDGNGYPYGLKNTEISLEAQVVSIADVLDALRSSKRSYRTAINKKEAIEMICSGQCGAFSPDLCTIIKNIRW